MIVFDLSCGQGHRFEGWFSSSEDYAGQQARGLVSCPHCGSAEIAKAPMAPAVPRKGNQRAVVTAEEEPPQQSVPVAAGMPPEVTQALEKLAEIQAEALKQSKWVGDDFADASRAMHYGEREVQVIHGKASAKQAKELLDEGIAVAPLLFPVAPPDELN
ncbi:hypothetical protein SZ64_05205 [Erythrobacter sp. SG61-1L]|uniref:DUF1178 family protein n=1 Tax=Erythrobacter sp. SG61-1L TaxID=1603897 RepID=UPI0006C93065|nr:DUF1178 family protein [Erythrobacter sp. SG61-1L]KPL67559.1 hypothetical protein SZ64_05205 [Erythrobacter sp. SG61-1L]